MPRFPFRKREGKQTTPSSSTSGLSSASKPSDTPPSWLPSEEDRVLVRQWVLEAATAVYDRHAVQVAVELDEDPDLNKDAKKNKMETQKASQESLQKRLQVVLFQELLSALSSWLLLPPDAQYSTNVSLNTDTDSKQSIPTDTLGCITLLLCNCILHSGEQGYDARIRNVIQIAAVHLLAQSLKRDDVDGQLALNFEQTKRKVVELEHQDSGLSFESTFSGFLGEADSEQKDEPEEEPSSPYRDDPYRQMANQKFQALEQAVANTILTRYVQKPKSKGTPDDDSKANDETEKNMFSKKNMVRAAKIGGMGVVAGTLFAVTGGMAAPAIATGLAALGVGGTVAGLATSVHLVALFGLGGGGLSAYKMKRRTDGLQEFTITRETYGNSLENKGGSQQEAHLHTTVCISGWLKDRPDFERPWGVTPSDLDRVETLQRFFAVHDPEMIDKAEDMLEPFQTDKACQNYWGALEEQYGRDPDHLLPLEPMKNPLSHTEDTSMLSILEGVIPANNTKSKAEAKQHVPETANTTTPRDSVPNTSSVSNPPDDAKPLDPIFRVWDFRAEHGGDLYTVQWETELLLKLCDVVNSMVRKAANKATEEVLKKTVLATIMSAVTLPLFLVDLAGMIDNEWALVSIRSDMAGVELAKSLLESEELRPVNLVGFSFGARIIIACLTELARHQDIWEEQQAASSQEDTTSKKRGSRRFSLEDEDETQIKYRREPASIVHDVVLMGAPVFASKSALRLCRHMVAGRFINCYSRKDWIMSLMFQYKSQAGLTKGICGTRAVTGVGGMENYDISKLVTTSHADYCRRVPEILDYVGYDQPFPLVVGEETIKSGEEETMKSGEE